MGKSYSHSTNDVLQEKGRWVVNLHDHHCLSLIMSALSIHTWLSSTVSRQCPLICTEYRVLRTVVEIPEPERMDYN